jgi:hypothetical protein
MGRLFQWIQSAASTRGSHRPAAAASSRRRLAFERCESRIALSAADGDLSDLVVDDQDQVLAFEDGGTITLSFTAADASVNWSAVKNQFDGIAVGHLTNFTIRTEPLVTLLQGSSVSSARQVIGDWDFAFSDNAMFVDKDAAIDSAFGMFDSTAEGDYGMSLSSPELTGPSVNSDLSVIPTPMPTPSEQPGAGNENEGGQIALTPFVAPTGLTLSNGYGSSSIARAKPTLEELRETPAARSSDAGRLESLRGRAVVYEVADASNDKAPLDEQAPDDGPMAERGAVELASLNDFSPDEFHRSIHRSAEIAAAAVEATLSAELPTAEDVALVAVNLFELESPAELSLNGDDAADSSALNDGSAANRDEAFAAWPAVESLDSHAAALTAPQGDRDRRMLGAGLAAALSFMPLRKALRRRGEQAAQQQMPRRQQTL